MLKRKFTDKQKYGLNETEIKLGQRWLRKNKTLSAIPEIECPKLLEMYLLGHTYEEIYHEFPQYELGRIIMTGALRLWYKQREEMSSSLKDRITAKVVKNVVDQIDFLSLLFQVTATEHIQSMKKYIEDPDNNPKPSFRIENIKDYKEVSEMFQKIVNVGGKSSTLKNTLEDIPKQSKKIEGKSTKKIAESAKSKDEDVEDITFEDIINEEKANE